MIRQTAYFCVFVFALAGAVVHADDWLLTTADFVVQPAQFKGLSGHDITVTSTDTGTDRTLSLEQFVSIQRAVIDPPPTPKFTLLLSNGDHLAGEPASVSGEKLGWNSPLLGRVSIPFSRLVLISKGDHATAPDEQPRQDLVTLTNGDTAAGVFTSCADGNVTLQADTGPTAIPFSSITRIAFAATGAAAGDNTRAFRLRLTDGSVFTVPDASADGDQLKITLPGKNASVVSLPLSDLLGIEQANGPVSWLSSKRPVENIQTPYLGGSSPWPARFDQSVDGSPLSFDGRIYDHGIGVHAYSRLTFSIDPQWTAFRTQYAIDSRRDDPARYADVTVRMKIDDKVVYEKTHVHAGELSPVVLTDLKGAAKLTLECDYGNAGDTQAHLNWLQPALLREAPPTTAPSVPQ